MGTGHPCPVIYTILAQARYPPTSMSTSTSSYSHEEQKALTTLAELYSGFYDPKIVARDLAGLTSVTAERMNELLRHKLHPALYTQLAWRGSGFESQKTLPIKELEDKLAAATRPEQMNVVTRFFCQRMWNYNLEQLWSDIKQDIVAIRQRQAAETASRPF